jgi:hypothetical protein
LVVVVVVEAGRVAPVRVPAQMVAQGAALAVKIMELLLQVQVLPVKVIMVEAGSLIIGTVAEVVAELVLLAAMPSVHQVVQTLSHLAAAQVVQDWLRLLVDQAHITPVVVEVVDMIQLHKAVQVVAAAVVMAPEI